MANINITNLFDLSYDQINAIKKKDLVSHNENPKRKVTVNSTINKYSCSGPPAFKSGSCRLRFS